MNSGRDLDERAEWNNRYHGRVDDGTDLVPVLECLPYGKRNLMRGR
ncbi:hypothetical protein OG225_20620 [Nocardia sp. NBC_01377]